MSFSGFIDFFQKGKVSARITILYIPVYCKILI